MESNTLYWDKYESRHKRLKDLSLDHIQAIVDELEREINLRTWEELPPFEAESYGHAQRVAWRLTFMAPGWRRIAQVLHRLGVSI